MGIGPATGPSQDLRITSWQDDGILTVELTWLEWDELCKDADHLRTTGQFRDTGLCNCPAPGHAGLVQLCPVHDHAPT